MWKLCGVGLLVFLVTVQGASLPDYIKPCATSDPNFNECALQHAKEALPHFIKGDRKLKLFPLDPLGIVELKLDEGDNRGIAYKLQNAKVTGFKDSQFETINFDLKNNKFFMKFTVPVLSILGTYDVSGRLLILPITGHGDLNSTTVEAKITFEGNLKREEKGGKKYIVVVDPKIKMIPKRVYIKMTNLFNGNELLGREMNEFMNKNWKEVNEEISPPVEQAIAEIVVGGINQMLGSTPEELLFPEKLP